MFPEAAFWLCLTQAGVMPPAPFAPARKFAPRVRDGKGTIARCFYLQFEALRGITDTSGGERVAEGDLGKYNFHQVQGRLNPF